MQVVFLGGADGIGASCVAVHLAGRWVLVDAGIRMGNAVDRLPDLAFLEGKDLAAIFVTHAHADHIGALPLVHHAFPNVPIYASRPTMLLMALMLEDALQIMGKRAVSDLEVPLYDDQLLHYTLKRLQPLPMQGYIGVPELPDVTVHVSLAGHVAGAVMLGFDAPDGSLLISGDVSITPQRTVPSASLPQLQQPDMMVLESTYGSRLHPNRQQEEQNLARAVAEGIARGGHVLIPAFALGRAQEVLRILHSAQRRGTIPPFPIWVDGLVRKVCGIYPAFPEALSKPMQRLIAGGLQPFTSDTIQFVDKPQQREQVVQGPPACLVTSSGMLTGGPSAFYASHLAEIPEASILITGYQDEEAPGRRLLALAEGQEGTLELNGKRVAMRCRVAKYALSAHADGSELAALVQSLKPRTVALVHGDSDARAALSTRFRDMPVVLPANGETFDIERKSQRKRARRVSTAAQQGIGEGMPIGKSDIERLWKAVADARMQPQIMSIRELALAWYGMAAGAEEEQAVQQVLAQGQARFVPLPDTPDMVRVAPPEGGMAVAATGGDALAPGVVVLLQANPNTLAFALAVDTGLQDIRAYPASATRRTRFPRSSVREVAGRWSRDLLPDEAAMREALRALVKETRQWRWRNPPAPLMQRLDPERTYTLDDIAHCAEIASDDLVARMGLALLLNETPRLFIAHATGFEPGKRPLYRLAPTWQDALSEGEGSVRPDQTEIRAIVESHLGNPPDLYRQSINPETGEVTLSFHFPAVARTTYADALGKAAVEAGVPITVALQPHQGELSRAAHAVLPPHVSVLKTSLHHPRQAIALRLEGPMSREAQQEAQQAFARQTGWTLELEGAGLAGGSSTIADEAPPTPPRAAPALDMHQAMNTVKAELGTESGCYKVSADQARQMLTVRFHFPDVAQPRYADTLARLAEQTGWQVTVYPQPHQGELEAMARRVLPPELSLVGAPSLYRGEQQMVVRCRGTASEQAIRAAEHAFAEATGWRLVIRTE